MQAVGLFVHGLEAPRVLETNPARGSRCDETKALHEEHALFVERLLLQALQLAGQRLGRRIPEMVGQRRRAEGRAVMELNRVGKPPAATRLQGDDAVDE